MRLVQGLDLVVGDNEGDKNGSMRRVVHTRNHEGEHLNRSESGVKMVAEKGVRCVSKSG
jgi:hypothetical protein